MYQFRFPALVFVVAAVFAYNLPDLADLLLPSTDEGIENALFYGFSLMFASLLSLFVWGWQKEKREKAKAAAAIAAAKAKKEAAPQAVPVKA